MTIFSLLLVTDEFRLNISNCAFLKISSDAFADTIFHGFMENVQEFVLMDGAFAFAKNGSRITILNSNLKRIQQLRASLREIRFVGCAIETIESNAFDVIKIDSIVFENCQIGAIQGKALTEKVCSIHN